MQRLISVNPSLLRINVTVVVLRRFHLESVIWKILYPAIKEASLVSDCLPEPPTPTRRALPHGVRMIREI